MTQEQQIASDPRHSVWVSASAGTGKTKILTDRVLRLLLAGARPGAILCITYTKAAAAEMLERIEKELGRWAVMEDKVLDERLKTLTQGPVLDAMHLRARQLFAQLLDSPHPLRVMTIHSFCQSIITRFPLEAGVSTHTTLLDERDASEMLQSARAKLFEAAQNDPTGVLAMALRELARTFAESTLGKVMESIIAQRRYFAPWLAADKGTEVFATQLRKAVQLPAGFTLKDAERQYFTYNVAEKKLLHSLLEALSKESGKQNDAFAKKLARWLAGESSAVEYAEAFYTAEGEFRKLLFTKAVATHLPDAAEIAQAEKSRVEPFMNLYKSWRMVESSQQLMVIAQAMLSHYREEKQRRGVIDYDDLISLTVDLLQRSGATMWVLFKLDTAIDHLLVDEAQDTSPQQWKIVEALVSEFYAGEGARAAHRTLFVVGDDKQSIFRFQGADPQIFEGMRLSIKRKADEAGHPFEPVRLYTSFRSTEAVLAAVDTVFATPAAKEGLVFSEAEITHAAHRTGQAGRVELWPLVEGEKREKKTIWERMELDFQPTPEQQMAQQIAKRIQSWLREGRMLTSKGRPVRPGDIMILVQRRGSFVDAMIRALKRAHVPVAGADRLVITDHIAVKDCMALADFLLLPQDDFALAALLKSPFAGLSEEDLFTLAHARSGKTLWQQLQGEQRFAPAKEFLSDMLARTDYASPYELFSHALVTLGKRMAIAARLGKETDDPLDEFLSLALQYERTHTPSLQGFMHWLRSSPPTIKRDMEQGKDEVRILTVHASKGLQAPIVFLPDTVHMPKPPENLQWLAQEPKLPLWAPLSEYADAHLTRLKDETKLSDLCEYRRLLYVAMTRPEDELYITGWKGTKSIISGCWYDLVKNAIAGKAGWVEQDGTHILTCEQKAPVKAASASVVAPSSPLPAWARQAAPSEPTPTKPLAPSRLNEDYSMANLSQDANAIARGVLAHRLLQYLPDCPSEQRAARKEQLVRRYGKELPMQERDAVVRQVMQVLDHPAFAAVFAPGSLAEVPIVGVVSNAKGESVTIAGQIDRLAVTKDRVLIVDFKSGRDIPRKEADIPSAYVQQMEAYRSLVQKIYPTHKVECALLWTAAPLLMAV